MGLLPLTYRRPPHVARVSNCSSSETSLRLDESSGESLKPVRSGSSGGIPSQLSFDRIIEGGTCPPCAIRDFMNYLIYVERSAENLQFFLWHRDYTRRFAEAKTADLALAPEWTQAMEEKAVSRIKKGHAEKARKARQPAASGGIFNGTDFEHSITGKGSTKGSVVVTETSESLANQAFASAGIKAPFTIQPFRKELDRVIATYIMDDAPRQLNLSDHEQKVVLNALAFTTHPSALNSIVQQVETTLRQQAHPNFVRWSICNGNPVRVTFARGLGVVTILLGIVMAVLLTLSSAPRGYRALATVVWVIGFATLMAAYKGMCVVLHGLHHRHIRPWELFESDSEAGEKTDDDDAMVYSGGGGETVSKSSLESFGSANSYEDEPWVMRYRRRNIIRKIFDREVWIEEPALRQIQDTIFVQSILFAVVCSGVLTSVFVGVPGGGFF